MTAVRHLGNPVLSSQATVWKRIAPPPWDRPKLQQQDAARTMLAGHDSTELFMAMRAGYLRYGISPAEMMDAWLQGGNPKGSYRIQLPQFPADARRAFERIRAEMQVVEPASRLGNTLWSLLNVLAVQMVDSRWIGRRITDVELPNLIDLEAIEGRDELGRPGGALYAALFDARSNVSYNVVYGNWPFPEPEPPGASPGPGRL
jgi:hypothetical protein